MKHDSLHNSENLLFDHGQFVAAPKKSKGYSFFDYTFLAAYNVLTFLQTAKVGVFLVQRDIRDFKQ